MNKDKFNIIYKNFAKPIAQMRMDYECSSITVDNDVVCPDVVKCFNQLSAALQRQLNKYR